MRALIAAAAVAVCVGASLVIETAAPKQTPPSLASISGASAFILANAPATDKQTPRVKPAPGGGDSCRWANDNECDEPDVGTGACPMGTDRSDCVRVRAGVEDDSCRWANDGECDEPGFGTGACVQGTDRTDCGELVRMRNQNDSCAAAFNGVCDEPGRGAGACAQRTDRSDCFGRARPMGITDHFFGHDDRVLVPVAEAPWRYMGQLAMDSGGHCSATLVARDVIATAAHCIHSNGQLNASGRFVTALGEHSARITAYLLDRNFNYQRYSTTDEIDGLDWTLLRLDRPLGDVVGFAPIADLTGQGEARALAADLLQAGYSWDTGDNLSGNLRCRMVRAYPDHTFAHECDTTRGDSGSGFLIRSGEGHRLIGVDSSFRRDPDGPFLYIAVSAAAFADQAPAFIAGRSGVELSRQRRKG